MFLICTCPPSLSVTPSDSIEVPLKAQSQSAHAMILIASAVALRNIANDEGCLAEALTV